VLYQNGTNIEGRNYIYYMVKNAGGGHEVIVRLCHDEWGAWKMSMQSLNWAMAGAARMAMKISCGTYEGR
jgi:hypothetical protein